MNDYSIALFLHIVGALGISVALGVESIGMSRIRQAMVSEEVRVILGVVKSTNRLGFVSMLTAVFTGIFMVLKVWGWVPWVIVTLGALVLYIVIFRVLTIPRMAAIGRALPTERSAVSQTFQKLVNHPILWTSIWTRVAIVLGIIFLKIAKPDLAGSLLTIGIAILFGLASLLPMARRIRTQGAAAD